MSELKRYSQEVVQAWDEASWNFKAACDQANSKTTVDKYFDESNVLKAWYASIESIDGVGTKVQIYTTAFEWYLREFEENKISEDELLEKAVDIWERMLHDLIAMNTDDLRKWEMAVSITNIIDINHLKWVRGKVFSDSMTHALANVIVNNDIRLTAGETAILGNPKQTQKVLSAQQETFDEVLSLLREQLWEWQVTQKVESILKEHDRRVEIILQEIEFNIGGTTKGITNGKDKLSPLKPWQVVVWLQEKSKEGIIWPRSNGITAIRKHMTELVGDEWENLAYDKFLELIWDKWDSIPEEIHMLCRWKKMWEIATGKSTVFNPFVSRTLLGWVDREKQVKLSSIIHVTGNPIKKTTEWASWVGLDLDISDMPVPTIIAILQHTLGISSEDAMKWWNMGLPYALICYEDQVDEVIDLAKKNGIVARRVGKTYEEKSYTKSQIKWVWIDNQTIVLSI